MISLLQGGNDQKKFWEKLSEFEFLFSLISLYFQFLGRKDAKFVVLKQNDKAFICLNDQYYLFWNEHEGCLSFDFLDSTRILGSCSGVCKHFLDWSKTLRYLREQLIKQQLFLSKVLFVFFEYLLLVCLQIEKLDKYIDKRSFLEAFANSHSWKLGLGFVNYDVVKNTSYISFSSGISA